MEPLNLGRAAASRFTRRTFLKGTSLAGLCWLSPVGQMLSSILMATFLGLEPST